MCLMFFTNVMAETEKSVDFAHRYIVVSFVVAQRWTIDRHMTKSRRKSAADFMISIGSININTS